MAIDSTPISFSTKLIQENRAYVTYSLVLPFEWAETLWKAKLKRVKGTINGVVFERAITRDGAHGYCLWFGKSSLKELKMRVGMEVALTIYPDLTPEVVTLPEELAEVLAQDEEGNQHWQKLTPGKQRGLAYYVDSAKSIDTRINRAFDMVNKLKTGQLFFQQQEQKKKKQ